MITMGGSKNPMKRFTLPLGAMNKLRRADQLIDIVVQGGAIHELLDSRANGQVVGQLVRARDVEYVEPPSINPSNITKVRFSGERVFHSVAGPALDFWPVPRMDQDPPRNVLPTAVM